MHQKETYWHISTWLLDVTVQNAWCFNREAGGSMPLLQFRREIVMHNLKTFGTESHPRGPRQSRSRMRETRPSKLGTIVTLFLQLL